MKSILIISPEPWNGLFVSKHHYALTLANNGYKVYFLDPPDNKYRDIQIIKVVNNLYHISAPQVIKGLQYLPKFVRNAFERKWLNILEKKINDNVDVIWLFENSRFYDLEFAGSRLKIYHQVDLNQDFHFKEASQTADICFVISKEIREKIISYNKNIFKIEHGLNLKMNINIPIEYIQKIENKKINIGYIGNLDDIYLDANMLAQVVKKHTDKVFHFIGNYSSNGVLYQQCNNLSNVKWWSRIESKYILSVLQNFDINMVVHKVDQYRDQLTNTHKLLEYLYSGKVVVSTYLDEYKDKRYLLEMVDNSKDYIDKFDEVVNNLEFYNSTEKQQQRIAFAKEHTYEKQLEKIKELIKQHTDKEL